LAAKVTVPPAPALVDAWVSSLLPTPTVRTVASPGESVPPLAFRLKPPPCCAGGVEMLTTRESDCPGASVVREGVTVTVGTEPPLWQLLHATAFLPPELADAWAQKTRASNPTARKDSMGGRMLPTARRPMRAVERTYSESPVPSGGGRG